MMAPNPRVTPVPVPAQGNSPTGLTAPPASQTQTPTPLGSTTGNRHVSPSGGSVTSAGEGRKMKRTGAKVNVRPSSFLQAPSWATSLLNSKPSTASTIPSLSESASSNAFSPSDSTANNPILESPEPIRIVSDIFPQETNQEIQEAEESPGLETDMAPKSSLARSAKIQALQQSWMTNSGLGGLGGAETAKDWLGGGLSSEDASSSSSQPPRKHPRKRSLETVQGGDPKRRLTEVTNGGSSPLSASAGPSDGARRSTRSSQVPTAIQGADVPNPVVKPGIIPIQRTVQATESSDEEDYNDGDLNGDLTTEDDDDLGPDADAAQDAPPSRQNVSAIRHPDGLVDVVVTDTSTQVLGKPTELFHTKDSDRLYSQWKGPSGLIEPTCGALLPTGYQLWDDPTYPWICPVRSCRNIFKSIIGVGKHFTSRHKNAMFNDNLDGTLSDVGSFTMPGQGRCSGVIVSRNPLRGDEPPMAEPETTVYKPTKHSPFNRLPVAPMSAPRTQNASPAGQSPLTRGSNNSGPPPGYTSLHQYLSSHLSTAYGIPSERPDIKALLKLPMKRELPDDWKMKYSGVGNLAPLAALSLLVFLTGDPPPFPCQTCAVSANFIDATLHPCIVLSQGAPSWLKETASESCASCQWNCSFKRFKADCEFYKLDNGSIPRRHQPSTLPARVETPVPPPAVPPVAPSKVYDPIPKNAKFPFPSTLARPDDSSSAPSSRAATPTVPAPKEPTNAPAPSSPPRRVTRYSSTTKASVTSASRPAPVPTVTATAEQTIPAEILEMEDWEMAPGRVRDERSHTPTNVAFSNAYLTSNQVVGVSEDISFNVVVIKPGGSHQWADEDDKVRICSLAAGKINVKLDKTDPFSIGPNGMFKLKPGVACSVENRTYIDAVVHVTSVTQY